MKRISVYDVPAAVKLVLLVLLLILPAAGCSAETNTSEESSQLSNAELCLPEEELDALISMMDIGMRLGPLEDADFTRLFLGAPIHTYVYESASMPEQGDPAYFLKESGLVYPIFYEGAVAADILVLGLDGNNICQLNVNIDYEWLNAMRGDSVAIIYDIDGLYFYDGVDFTLGYEYTDAHGHDDTRGSVADGFAADMNSIVLTDFTVTTPIDYILASDE